MSLSALIKTNTDIVGDILQRSNNPQIRKVCKIFLKITDEKVKFYICNRKIGKVKPPECFRINIYLNHKSITDIIDISVCGHGYTLSLSWIDIRDASVLGYIHNLNLSWTDIEDVSMLGKVHIINLGWTKVKNVSLINFYKAV